MRSIPLLVISQLLLARALAQTTLPVQAPAQAEPRTSESPPGFHEHDGSFFRAYIGGPTYARMSSGALAIDGEGAELALSAGLPSPKT